MRDRSERVADAGRRDAGCLDHDLKAVGGDQFRPAFDDAGAAAASRLVPTLGGEPRFGVAGGAQGAAGALGAEIGDAKQVQPGQPLNLAQEHRAELARADQADAQRIARLRPLRQDLQELTVHRPASRGRVRTVRPFGGSVARRPAPGNRAALVRGRVVECGYSPPG